MFSFANIKLGSWQVAVSAAVGVALSFIMPIASFLYLMVGSVIVDLITGIRAAKKRGEKILSGGLGRTIEKFVVYFLAILLAEGIRKVLSPAIPVTYAVTTIIVVTEFKSVLENVEEVTGTPILGYLKKKFPNLFSNNKNDTQ